MADKKLSNARYGDMIEFFTKEKDQFEKLKKQYQETLTESKDSFVFTFPWGQKWEILTDYAKYLIQYLERRAL